MEIKIRVDQSKPNINLQLKDTIIVYREGEPQIVDVEYTENGEYVITPDDGVVFENVNIKVNVPLPEGTLDIIENGEVDVTKYAKVNVNISAIGEDMLQTLIDVDNNCEYLFYSYNGTNLDFIKNLDTSKVTSMANMFNYCSNLISIPQLNTSNVTNMANMFSNCNKLTTIPQLNTSKVTTMASMFHNCNNFTTIPQLDTSKVANMGSMFYNCKALTSVPQLDVSKVTSMTNMFYKCASLKSILMYGMKVNFDISASTQFETEDLVTILNNLATITNTRTLTMGSTNLAKLSDEQKQIAINKGWTLA